MSFALKRKPIPSDEGIPFDCRKHHRALWTDEDISYWFHLNDFYRAAMHSECGIPKYDDYEILEILRIQNNLLSEELERIRSETNEKVQTVKKYKLGEKHLTKCL